MKPNLKLVTRNLPTADPAVHLEVPAGLELVKLSSSVPQSDSERDALRFLQSLIEVPSNPEAALPPGDLEARTETAPALFQTESGSDEGELGYTDLPNPLGATTWAIRDDVNLPYYC